MEELDAIHENRITRRGKEILSLPAHPRIAHMLLEGKDAGLAGLSCDVAAILEERDPLPPDSGSDIRLRVEALIKYRKNIRVNADSSTLQRIERISASWRSFLKTNAHSGDAEETGKLITAAYPERIALQMDAHSSRYKLNNGKSAKLPEVDPLIHEKWLAIAQMDAGQKEGRIFLAAPVRPEELESFFQEKNILKWDKSLGILVANAELRIGTLPWKSQVLKNIPSAESIPILCEAIRNQPDLLDWAENVSSFQNRILSLKTWRTKEEWPDLSTTALLASTEKWLSSSLAGIKKTDDFKRIKILDLLRGMLSWDLLQMAERFAPSAIEVPTGSKINLEYFHDGKAPVLAVRLQEMFGQMETPTVNEGRNPVLIHLLSPAYRPAAVTQDLRSFWQNAYSDVRKDLRGRYPKHSWPEDPFTAVAVKGVKRKG